ncbi:hypothetical protein PVL29_019244 [Vitis rotundifolia]|uniref:RING-CH-type domain-containing protein n=1 Tax=Vitis rotundifolia TaxID=103349 RepID=A0AA38Z706_VITRO|nr:hypothetical protein PVL29_019244 [Vitis rotundifolia]
MADHLALYSNRLITPPTLELMHKEEEKRLAEEGSCQQTAELNSNWAMDGYSFSDEEDGFSIKAECRICQEDDLVQNMEAPCACNGSLKVKIFPFFILITCHQTANRILVRCYIILLDYISRLNDKQIPCLSQYAHRKCIQRWCNEKKSIVCEICLQGGDTGINVLEPDCAATTARMTSLCQTLLLIVTASILLGNAAPIPGRIHDGYVSFSTNGFLGRLMEFLLPSYALIWAISLLVKLKRRFEGRRRLPLEAMRLQSGRREVELREDDLNIENGTLHHF